MKKLLLMFGFFFCAVLMVNAQDYKTAVGLRGGISQGLTVKYFVSEQHAFEGILTTRWHGSLLTGLYEKHKDFNAVPLKWYYGYGAHAGFWEGFDNHPWFDDDDSHFTLGIDGILGIEYTFDNLPINISLDWKPFFEIVGYSGFEGDSGAISVRYTFK